VERDLGRCEAICLQCGYERDIPAEVKPVVNKQEVIKVAESVDVIKSKGQILYEKHAKEKELKTPWSCLPIIYKVNYERKAKGEVIPRKNGKSLVAANNEFNQKIEQRFLPPWNEAWGDAVKVAWLEAVSCIKQ